MIIMNVEPVDVDNELFISDLDGTLLSPQHQISPYTKTVLQRAIQLGLKFSVASARSYHSIRQILSDLPLNRPIIANNGAVIYSPEGKCLYRALIHGALLESIFEAIKKLGFLPLLSIEGNTSKLYYAKDCPKCIRDYMATKRATGDTRLTEISDVFSVKEGIITITLLDDTKVLENAYEQLKRLKLDGLNMYLMPLPEGHGLSTLTINSKEADKGIAVKRLMAMEDRPLKVTVFGDHLNDLSLFAVADTKVAVENAQPALKAVADRCVHSNAADGVARYLEERLDLK